MNHSIQRIAFAFIGFFLFASLPSGMAKQSGHLSEAYGMVKSISDNEMVVTVYDEKKSAVQDQTFTLSADTQLVIVRPATELIEGDEVKINFEKSKGKNAARFISILDLPVPAEPAA